MPLHPDFLEMLVCPSCRGAVTQTEDASGLVCPACAVVYPIRDDIPVMLVEEATPYRPS